MRNRLLGLLMAVAGSCLLASPVPVLGADSWEVALKIKAGAAENRLSFGQHADASEGIDGRYDVPAMLAGSLRAYFQLNGSQQYWRDIRALTSGMTQTRILWVETDLSGQTVSLSWTREDFPQASSVELVDLTSQEAFDMLQQGSYLFTSGDTARQFQIVIR